MVADQDVSHRPREAVSGRRSVSETASSRRPACFPVHGYMSMSYAVVFETDSLPMFVGEYTTLDEAYEVAIRLVRDFRDSGLSSLYKFRIEPNS